MIRKMLTFVALAGWAVGVVSWWPLWQIEGDALRQPDEPSPLYSRPMNLKGVTRYVTVEQDRLNRLALIGFVSGIAAGAVAGGTLKWLDIFRDEKAQRKPKDSN